MKLFSKKFEGVNAKYDPQSAESKFVVSPLYQTTKALSHMLQIGIIKHDEYNPKGTLVYPNQGPVHATEGAMDAPEKEVRRIEWFHGLPKAEADKVGFESPWERGQFYMNNPEQVKPEQLNSKSIGPFYDLYSRALHEVAGDDNGVYTYAYDEPLWPTVLNQLFGNYAAAADKPYYAVLHIAPVEKTFRHAGEEHTRPSTM